MKSCDIFQPSFFHWQKKCLSIENLQKTCFAMSYWISKKRLKIDHFERGISQQLPIVYDGIHMQLLNLELFVSKALTFSEIFFNFYVFIVVQDLGPGPPSL